MNPLDIPPRLTPLREHPQWRLTPMFRYALGLVCEACADPYDPMMIRHAVLDVETVPGSLNTYGKLRRLEADIGRGLPPEKRPMLARRIGWCADILDLQNRVDSEHPAHVDQAKSALLCIRSTIGNLPTFSEQGAQLFSIYGALGFAAAWTKAESADELAALRQIVRYERHSRHTDTAMLADWVRAHDAEIDRQLAKETP
jgi:hypothetical protein